MTHRKQIAMSIKLLAVLLIGCCLASQQVSGQEVEAEIRSPNLDKVGGAADGQARNVYSQTRLLTPHRMMHFGKRPEVIAPPSILEVAKLQNPVVSNLMDRQQEQQALAMMEQSERFPYLFTIELDQGRTLRAMPEDVEQIKKERYNFERPLSGDFEQPAMDANGQRLLRLISGIETSNAEVATNNLGADKQQPQDQSINVATRSTQPSRNLVFPKAFLSSFLYGAPRPAPPSYAPAYIKKTEPRENLFMHFG